MMSQPRHLVRTLKTKENEAPSLVINRGTSELNSSNVSTLSPKQLKDAVLRNMTLEEIEALKEEASRYRTARGVGMQQQELDSTAKNKAAIL